jgi:prophage regulatory protein
MAVRLIPYEALAPRGICYSKPTLWRKEKAGTFPKRVPIGAGRYAYVEGEIDAYIEQKIADRDAKLPAEAKVIQRDDGRYQVGAADDAPGPFETRQFAEAVAAKVPA